MLSSTFPFVLALVLRELDVTSAVPSPNRSLASQRDRLIPIYMSLS